MSIALYRRLAFPLIIYCFALAIRLLVSWQGISGSEKIFYRPDSSGYINPAKALIDKLEYNKAPDSALKEVGRPPLTSLFFSLIILSGKISSPPSIMLIIIFSFIPVLIYHIALFLKLSYKIALFIALLSGINITLTAHAPLYLSDSLFTLAVAMLFYFFLKAINTGSRFYYFISSLVWGLSTLIRPASIMLAPLLVLILICRSVKWLHIKTFIILLLLSSLIPASWLYRNYCLGAGFNLGTKISDHLFNITSIVEAGERKENISDLKKKLMVAADFKCRDMTNAAYEGCVVEFAKKNFKKSVKKYPAAYLRKFIFNYYVLLPDLPTLCQLLGVSQRGKGTLHVLQKEGLIKAVKFYFAEKTYLIFIFFPLILLYFVVVVFSFLEFLFRIKEKDFFFSSLFISFVLYFLLQGGVVTVPRYQLPALPMIYISAGFFIMRSNRKGLDSAN